MSSLPVTYIPQLDGLCGAASAQMILHAQNTGIGTSNTEQQQLWDEIKETTTVPKGVTVVPGETNHSACEPYKRRFASARRTGFAGAPSPPPSWLSCCNIRPR